MYKQLIINVSEHETRVAHLEDGTISELYIDRGDDSDVTGNIYKGRVLRVLPGMQAAFVDIGLNQAAFIYVDDVYTDDFKEYEHMFEIDSEEEDSETENDPDLPAFENKRNFLIEELLYFAALSISRFDAQIGSYRHFPQDRRSRRAGALTQCCPKFAHQ